MINTSFFSIFFLCFNAMVLFSVKASDTLITNKNDNYDLIQNRILELNKKTPIDLKFNDQVFDYINKYLSTDKKLISKMLAYSEHYFPMMEAMLDKHELPLELKYLSIVESGLNPKARSVSGAVGLWQFMYLTGIQYNLSVSSYIDERQDPFKSTESACIYFKKLYENFGDWSLVLAAYNGGPGYIQRKILDTEINSYWNLQQHLRTETRNYVPKFIAINYLMNYYKEHNITKDEVKISFHEIDSIKLKNQVALKSLISITCTSREVIEYLNPSYKRNIFPESAFIVLPKEIINDFLLNEESNYKTMSLINEKQILVDEDRIVYKVQKGDYLGKIANKYNVNIYNLKNWNKLKSTKITEGDKMVIFVEKEHLKKISFDSFRKEEYVVKKGDTLWSIAQKIEGITVSEIQELNNIKEGYLQPGTKILIPII